MLAVFYAFFLYNASGQDVISEKQLGDIIVTMKETKPYYDLDGEINIIFEVTNTQKKTARFCKRNSPLEGQFAANYLIVIDEIERTCEYTGQSFDRMPPKEIEYISLEGMTKTAMEIDLKKGYKFDTIGKYSVIFKGDKINGLPDSEPLTIILQ